jgi:hypothetical protein
MELEFSHNASPQKEQCEQDPTVSRVDQHECVLSATEAFPQFYKRSLILRNLNSMGFSPTPQLFR